MVPNGSKNHSKFIKRLITAGPVNKASLTLAVFVSDIMLAIQINECSTVQIIY